MAKTRAKDAAPADSDVGLASVSGTAIPNIICEVLPNNSVNPPENDTSKVGTVKPLGPGDTFETEGPTAIALVQGGHVKIVGSVEPK